MDYDCGPQLLVALEFARILRPKPPESSPAILAASNHQATLRLADRSEPRCECDTHCSCHGRPSRAYQRRYKAGRSELPFRSIVVIKGTFAHKELYLSPHHANHTHPEFPSSPATVHQYQSLPTACDTPAHKTQCDHPDPASPVAAPHGDDSSPEQNQSCCVVRMHKPREAADSEPVNLHDETEFPGKRLAKIHCSSWPILQVLRLYRAAHNPADPDFLNPVHR